MKKTTFCSKALFDRVGEKIVNSGLEIVEAIDISRYEENHVLFHCIKSFWIQLDDINILEKI